MNESIIRKFLREQMYQEGLKQLTLTREEYVDAALSILSDFVEPLDKSDLSWLGWTDQRISALLRKMTEVGMLERTYVERVAKYHINSVFAEKLDRLKSLTGFDSSDEVDRKSKEQSIINDIAYDVEKITSDRNKLIQYMKHIVHLETDIYALKKRYDELLLSWEDAVVESIDESFKAEETVKKLKEQLEGEAQTLKARITTKPSETTKYVQLELPVAPDKPIFEAVKPSVPDYKKAGLFNKKKINEENDELKRKYEEALNLYNSLYQKHQEKEEQYQTAVADYNRRVEEIQAEERKQNEEAYKEALAEYDRMCEAWGLELAEKEAVIANFDANKAVKIAEILEQSETYSKQLRIEQELQYIVKQIGKSYEVQAKLYSYGVIYGKYRSYIAMSSFLDYFMSGRVTALEGPDGAYNLYEQESRADIIIGKLDVIIDSLEDIKENQYFIYNELQAANSMLMLINAQLLFNNVVQIEQLKTLDRIAENTETIAYNTQVTAFYTKKTAELTDALGFMMAL